MVSLKNSLDEMALESLYDMRLAQPPKDRLHYFDVVMEGSVETKANLLQKLYTDIVSKSNMDVGQIPDSQGVLTKYKGYKTMTEAMGYLNQLFQGTPSDEITMMNKLHDIIIACRKDYEFGYKFDVEILKISYCVSVLTLYELINICILAYTTEMRKDAGIKFDFKKIKKKDVLVIRGAKSLIKSYETGQWSKLTNEIKKDPSIIGIGNGVVATEGISLKGFTDAAKKVDGMLFKDTSIGDAVDSAKKAINNIPGIVKIPAMIIVGAIAVLISVRTLVNFFFCSSSKLRDFLRTQQDFINFVVQQEKEDGTLDTVISKHTKLADRLGNIASFIEVHILKTNTDAKKAIEASDKDNFSKDELTSTSSFGGDISF